jgi:8-oxo-dGTP diphosphatase
MAKFITYRFCPFCKGNLKNSPEFYSCPDCKRIIYKNSKPTGSILVIEKDKMLLGKRSENPFKGCWDVLGGFLKNGEPPETGALRETKEEAGIDVEILDLLGVYMDIYIFNNEEHKTINFHYVAKLKGQKPTAGSDMGKLKWFPIDKPPKNLGFAQSVEAIHALQKWVEKNKNRGLW